MAEQLYIVNSAGDIEQVSAPVYAKWKTAADLDGAVAAISFVQKYLRTGDPSARQQVPDEQFTSGSALGFVASLLDWECSKTVLQFGRFRHFQVYKTDAGSNFVHVRAYNRGLAAGFRLGQAFSDAAKNVWLKAIRKLANFDHYSDGGNSSPGGGGSPGVANSFGYVIGLAGAVQSTIVMVATTKEYSFEDAQKLQIEMQRLAALQAILSTVINEQARSSMEAARNLR